MSERSQEHKVKDVGVDNDCICIELLNGLRLMGPLRTKPIYRDPVVPVPRLVAVGELSPAVA